MSDRVVQEKILRLQEGSRPRVLDLFSGCGGLSLGFNAVGFEITAAIEREPTAAASYRANFHPDDVSRVFEGDIASTNPEAFVGALKLGGVAEAFDVIVGGPPCQAFARVGRAKLRELDEDPEAFRNDPRATLYSSYLNYVRSCRPVAILLENVPDVMNFGGLNVAQEICDELQELGYNCAYSLLNSAFYGVPQMRERMILVAHHRRLQRSVSFPAPSHWIELPRGYEGSRRVALKLLPGDRSDEETVGYAEPPVVGADLKPAVTAEEAIGDLPVIDARAQVRAGILRRGARRFDTLVRYDENRSVSPYGRAMRDWAGFEAGDGVYDHVIRFLPRDFELFARMSEGDQYPEAHEIALSVLGERLSELAQQGHSVKSDSEEYLNLKRKIVPPYDTGKFPNKWRKMSRDQPVRTVMAHLSKDSYSHIHYDSEQARTISVREAARLQSFPDGFIFKGAMNQAFQQIGNAVPPLLAKAIATEMMSTITGSARDELNHAADEAGTRETPGSGSVDRDVPAAA